LKIVKAAKLNLC